MHAGEWVGRANPTLMPSSFAVPQNENTQSQMEIFPSQIGIFTPTYGLSRGEVGGQARRELMGYARNEHRCRPANGLTALTQNLRTA